MEKLSTDFKKFMSGSPKDDNGAVAAAEPEQLIGGRTSLDELWSCTTCGGCVNACPVLIEHVDDIVDMRRNLVLMQSSFPEELQRTFTALENEGNPWGVSSHSRADWIGDSGVKVLDEGETTPLLYWVGCAGAVDSRARKVTQAMVKILKAANVDFAVLGARETCTGDPARRVGNEYLYQTLAKMNIETLNGNKIQKIVTQCPHCFNTLGKEYPDLGGNYEVVHHSEFIAELIKEGKLKPEARVMENELITFHDPCYLGRWNGVVEEPREVIGALRGTKQIEMERSGKNSFCCGAGGGRMWMEEHIGTPVNKERSREAIETGATTVAVGCPFCNTMITDGVKDLGKGESVKVKDIAELVADSLK
ncbi:(Fe-S)-binding protein [Candidatus Sumerlaeota bacterium]|nr:(Fe-S)-binding protein [Candidatus Sumerlaeota bacterium]